MEVVEGRRLVLAWSGFGGILISSAGMVNGSNASIVAWHSVNLGWKGPALRVLAGGRRLLFSVVRNPRARKAHQLHHPLVAGQLSPFLKR